MNKNRRCQITESQFSFCITFVLMLFCHGEVHLAVAAPTDKPLVFNRDIRPIMADKCFACHGFDAKQRKAGLRLDTAEGATSKAESGKVAIQPGDLQRSELWLRITSTDPDVLMPPADLHKTLTPVEIDTLRRWIEQNAPYQRHWAFESLERPSVPGESGDHPVDAFVAKKLREAGLMLSREADRETLLRRATLDFTGLPPTPEEVDQFLADQSLNAFEKQVDRLLALPQYGERQASLWMDAARYGDTNGYLHDISRTGWPWRDWVIRSFNEDLPFDQFVTQQLAGDLLPSATPEQILPTAFLRNHPITSEGGTLSAEYLNEYAADRVQTVGTVFLGLSFNCCRCHDHKFDPLTQDDFYSLQAYFNSTTEKHSENDTSSAYPPLIEIPSPLAPALGPAKVMVMQEAPEPTPTFVLQRGQYDQPDRARSVKRRPPTVFAAPPDELPKDRLGLARWLVSSDNPLLARVTVNRLWSQLFGTGLVKTVEDFGVQGDFPSHPELLDFLAVEFRDGDVARLAKPWSTKHLIRLIVTSATYRQSSVIHPDSFAKDSENRLLSRFPRQRLTAEQIRDQALFAAGLMSNKQGGPPVFAYQPAGLWEERANEASNTRVYQRSEGESLYRRSLYSFWKKTCPPPVMSVFDVPDRLSCSVRRSTTNTPLQALATLNDEQFLECARFLAARTLQEEGSERQRLQRLFRRATGHTPKEADLQILEAGLIHLLTRYRASPDDADKLLQQGAMPSPKDLDKPELAAWMLIANAVLNLDQTLVRD